MSVSCGLTCDDGEDQFGNFAMWSFPVSGPRSLLRGQVVDQRSRWWDRVSGMFPISRESNCGCGGGGWQILVRRRRRWTPFWTHSFQFQDYEDIEDHDKGEGNLCFFIVSMKPHKLRPIQILKNPLTAKLMMNEYTIKIDSPVHVSELGQNMLQLICSSKKNRKTSY